MKESTIFPILLTLVATACTQPNAIKAVDAGVDTGDHSRAMSDAAGEANLNNGFPRPMEWAVGTWSGTVPAEVSPGVPSRLAGKTVQIKITGIGRKFETSDGPGCFYLGALTWDLGGQEDATEPLDENTGTNAYWVYDPKRNVERFDVNANFGVGCMVSLHTEVLGPTRTSPTEVMVNWNIESSSVAENTGGNPATRMRLKKH